MQDEVDAVRRDPFVIRSVGRTSNALAGRHAAASSQFAASSEATCLRQRGGVERSIRYKDSCQFVEVERTERARGVDEIQSR